MNISFRKKNNSDKWIKQFIITHWSSDFIIVHGNSYCPDQLPGFVAEVKDKIAGLITYLISDDYCEIITLNSVIKRVGIGGELLHLVIQEAERQRCNYVTLTTTNDNLPAINFYRNKGFDLYKIVPGAVSVSRQLKPEIPLYNDEGMEIKDELEFRIMIKN